jgi:hypothetical protein
MHGLINRSIQCFLRDTYGEKIWREVTIGAGLGFYNFEALLRYDVSQTEAVLSAASRNLSKPRDVLLEDLGTYLVSNPNVQALRRLLRFGGEGFVDFLHSLDQLHERAKLAVPDLRLPVLQLHDNSASTFSITVEYPQPGFGFVLVGVLRAMADDYGALALIEYQGRKDRYETIGVELLETRFAEGRDFALSARPG